MLLKIGWTPCHVYSVMLHPCAVWHRVDGLPGTVAALLHSVVESPCTVACPLCVTSRPAPYCRHLAASMSCTHLMLPIYHIWLSCTHLMHCLLHVAGKVMMSLMSDVLGSRLRGWWASRISRPVKYFFFCLWPITRRELCDIWRHQSPPALGGGSENMKHVATSEPSPGGRRAWCHATHHNARALPHQEAGVEPWDTWRHQSPPSSGGGTGVTVHVAMLRPPVPGVGSYAVELNLSLVCRGIQSVGYRQ
jgi:hypothetical protein